MRRIEVDEFAGVVLDVLTAVCAERRKPGDIPRNMDRDEAVRWLITAGADPAMLHTHLSTAVRGDLEDGRLIQGGGWTT